MVPKGKSKLGPLAAEIGEGGDEKDDEGLGGGGREGPIRVGPQKKKTTWQNPQIKGGHTPVPQLKSINFASGWCLSEKLVTTTLRIRRQQGKGECGRRNRTERTAGMLPREKCNAVVEGVNTDLSARKKQPFFRKSNDALPARSRKQILEPGALLAGVEMLSRTRSCSPKGQSGVAAKKWGGGPRREFEEGGEIFALHQPLP